MWCKLPLRVFFVQHTVLWVLSVQGSMFGSIRPFLPIFTHFLPIANLTNAFSYNIPVSTIQPSTQYFQLFAFGNLLLWIAIASLALGKSQVPQLPWMSVGFSIPLKPNSMRSWGPKFVKMRTQNGRCRNYFGMCRKYFGRCKEVHILASGKIILGGAKIILHLFFTFSEFIWGRKIE